MGLLTAETKGLGVFVFTILNEMLKSNTPWRRDLRSSRWPR